MSGTRVVLVEDVGVTMVTPPVAQLPVPSAGKSVEQLFVAHGQQGEEVLISEVT